MSLDQVNRVSEPVLANVARAIVHKEDEVRLCLVTLLCQGHLLIEDVPGVGKTMLIRHAGRTQRDNRPFRLADSARVL